MTKLTSEEKRSILEWMESETGSLFFSKVLGGMQDDLLIRLQDDLSHEETIATRASIRQLTKVVLQHDLIQDELEQIARENAEKIRGEETP